MISTSEIERAADILRSGGLVVFPTETVYGLGANALDERAVERIFQAKGRPASSPLIVHAATIDHARQWTLEWPEAAEELAGRHWPGPLTLVLPKSPAIPDRVTAGLPTVGIRVPRHPVAQELLMRAELPVAAPSANRFTRLSPTASAHVDRDLADIVLDGGPSEVGIESTVIGFDEGQPVLLRPGTIQVSDARPYTGTLPLSPGLHRRHYSPRTPLYLGMENAPATGRGHRFRLPDDPVRGAAELYATLHKLDSENFDWIAVDLPPERPEWAGVRDRLIRAAAR
jgi:L-threonylcarbamoyladenylate synthase